MTVRTDKYYTVCTPHTRCMTQGLHVPWQGYGFNRDTTSKLCRVAEEQVPGASPESNGALREQGSSCGCVLDSGLPWQTSLSHCTSMCTCSVSTSTVTATQDRRQILHGKERILTKIILFRILEPEENVQPEGNLHLENLACKDTCMRRCLAPSMGDQRFLAISHAYKLSG